MLTYYYPLCDADPRAARQKLLDMDWRDCVELTLADLSRAHADIRPLVERIDVMRWGHAMIRPQPGFIFHADRRAGGRAVSRHPFCQHRSERRGIVRGSVLSWSASGGGSIARARPRGLVAPVRSCRRIRLFSLRAAPRYRKDAYGRKSLSIAGVR